jgi:hypothetical protein
VSPEDAADLPEREERDERDNEHQHVQRALVGNAEALTFWIGSAGSSDTLTVVLI